QLSLAIGKKGQNARLAAKLTGLRIDIKSESEIEADRVRLEEEMTEGRRALSELLDATPALVDKLVGGGLHSPALVGRAGAGRVAHAFRKPCAAGADLVEEVRGLWRHESR